MVAPKHQLSTALSALWVALCCLALPASAFTASDDHTPEVLGRTDSRAAAQLAYGAHYMAVTANPHATRTAQRILARGGSAADAAIAAQLVLGLVEPQASGLGGGAFLLYWDKKRRRLVTLDGREKAPRHLPEDHFLLPDTKATPMEFLDAVIGGHAVGVPGVPALLATLHARYGRLKWKTLFEDAQQLATEGFEVSPRLNALLHNTPGIERHPSLAAWLLDADGQPWPVGHLLRNPEYAATLRNMARTGVTPFYHGRMGAQIAKAVQLDPIRPGLLSRADMRRYRVRERPPLCRKFRNYRVCGMPPPSSGGSTVLAILGLIEHFDRGKWPKTAADSPAGIHLFAEATRLSFADRNAYIADPSYVSIPLDGMLTPEYLAHRAQLIKPGQALHADDISAGMPAQPWRRGRGHSPERPSTTHMSLVDRYGNVLSMTSSIESAFGSRLMVHGFLLNNQLTDFSFSPRDPQGALIANRPAAGKRPRSSMAPTIVFDQSNQPVLALGSPGGARIIPYVAQVLWQYLGEAPARHESEEFWESSGHKKRPFARRAQQHQHQPRELPGIQLPLEQALSAPHIVHLGGGLELEEGHQWPVDPEPTLRQLGHQPKRRQHNSGLHAVEITPWGFKGVADPRREGLAAGG